MFLSFLRDMRISITLFSSLKVYDCNACNNIPPLVQSGKKKSFLGTIFCIVIYFHFYNFYKSARQEARRFFPSPWDYKIIRRIGFRFPSESTQNFLHSRIQAHRARVRARPFGVSRGCARRANLAWLCPLLRKVFQNCAKSCLVWQCGKKTELARESYRRRSSTTIDGETSEFCIRTNSSDCSRSRSVWERRRANPQNRQQECIRTLIS